MQGCRTRSAYLLAGQSAGFVFSYGIRCGTSQRFRCGKTVMSTTRTISTVRVNGSRWLSCPPSKKLLVSKAIPPQEIRCALWKRFSSTLPTITTQENTLAVVKEDGNMLEIHWSEGGKSQFNSTWLRHQCHCEQCKQLGSGQMLVNPSSLPPLLSIKSALAVNKSVTITWAEDGHTGQIPLGYLQDNAVTDFSLFESIQSSSPDPLEHIPEVDYGDLIRDKREILRWMSDISSSGISIVRGTPVKPGTVGDIAELIAPVQNTIYGHVFQVRNSPNPINAAYSTAELPLHTDLVYYESPPGLQLLHCISCNDNIIGGESTFRDGFHAAEELRQLYPDDFSTLVRMAATFQKIHYERERPVHMRYYRPHIVINSLGCITAINWSPPFEGPLKIPASEIDAYYMAYTKFAKLIEDSPRKIQFRLKPGDAVVFNNRRILHGRREFKLCEDTDRFLEGCYINIDEFKSQLMVYHSMYGTDKQFNFKRVSNQDFYH
ncbi:PREDICTED: probable gamma-butyrobetaine dioxygenase [Priapulus caudatus]|uniref:Probable gamma-butyrobetaine dioxygenase n=1 Tax=Priapulus caudatus TaxID=37621 RepID=A0ABM1EQ54_PRICU|nr:PREDICTED: probable gamma-butyrobetaine dioxygenase [Priapulus caudatus]XP_014674325.1 PREDICTED: probable gamma-butyrobetaine dioxygenase [Priapulus caudatus]XP_014674405.1 PREDICTED: probable gamma-butyrobetaine dioxygenase [Priapulus caudatus]